MVLEGYRVLSCEGGDQVGKADAILNLRTNLLKGGVPVTYSSFPIYATPIGSVIRTILKEGFGELKFNPLDELRIKMSLFALNRLEFLDVLLSSPKYSSTTIILDRSSFSNAVTIGYALSTNLMIKKKEIDDLVDLAFELDKLMIEKLKLTECVVQLISLCDSWDNIRSENRDRHESKDAQILSQEVYKRFSKKVGRGWKQVVTKDGDGWRSRKDISEEILDFLNDRFGKVSKVSKPISLEIGVEEIVDGMYLGASWEDSDLKMYLEGLRRNEKDQMYEYALKVGFSIAESYGKMVFKNDDVRDAFGEILERSPQILDVLSVHLSPNYRKRVQEALL